jgi:hypothetical protein
MVRPVRATCKAVGAALAANGLKTRFADKSAPTFLLLAPVGATLVANGPNLVRG